jgi:hypothetical protein
VVVSCVEWSGKIRNGSAEEMSSGKASRTPVLRLWQDKGGASVL